MSATWVVVAVHNRLDLTRGCIEALLSGPGGVFSVVVVDAGSTDGTSEMLLGFPGLHVLQADESMWWSACTNAGVQYALDRGAEYVVTLNDDTVPGRDFVKNLVACATQHPGALVGALEVDVESGEVIYLGEKIDWGVARFRPVARFVSPRDPLRLRAVTHLPGRGMAVPRLVFEEIGLFDEEHFPQTGADYDFACRALRAGHPLYCAWDVVLDVYSRESGGVRLRSDFSWRNYREHLFGMHGAGNLRVFVWFALRNCPKRYLIQFVSIGLLRRVGGYLRDWALQGIRTRAGERT